MEREATEGKSHQQQGGAVVTDVIREYKNGKLTVRRGDVTATVDLRCEGMKRWTIRVDRLYRIYYGPFARHENKPEGGVSEKDARLLEQAPTYENKLAVAQKMLDVHFYLAERARERESANKDDVRNE
jgi:hypothetical protein